MHNKGKNKPRKGISLIVLVITIIVIIILATAVIVTLMQNSPIKNAKEAVNANDIKVAQESFIMWMSKRWIEAPGEAGALYSGEITKEKSTVTVTKENDKTARENIELASLDENITVASDDVKNEITLTLSDLGIDNLDKIVINQNVVISVTKGNITIDNEEEKTEYPKVEVETIVSKANSTITGKNPTYQNPVIPVGFKAINTDSAKWIDSDNDGIIDGWNNGLVIQDENKNEFVWVPIDGINIKYEMNLNYPSYNKRTTENTKDDISAVPVDDQMNQINNYQGFYIARYETGVPDNQKEIDGTSNNSNTEGIPTVKKTKKVWGNITYENSKNNAKLLCNSNYVKSGLITATAWDSACTWIESEKNSAGSAVHSVTNSSSWGLYSSSKATAGSNEKYKAKNIYDLAGNTWEWVAELYNSKNVLCGGCAINTGSENPASYHHNQVPYSTHDLYTSRIMLYII